MELTDSPRIQVRQRYVKDWDTIVRPGLGELRLRELTVSRISTFLHAQAALTKRGSRMRQSRTVLSLILAKAVRYDAIEYNPVQRLDKFARAPKHEVQTLDLEQIAAIRSAAHYYRSSPRTYGPKPDLAVPRIIEVMIGTGLRISELLALRKCDVDLMSRPPRLSVRGSLVQLDGVGLIRQPFTKSAAGMRDLPLPEFVAQAIREQLVVIANEEPESPLFPSQKRTFRSPANVRRTMRGIREAAAGVPDWIDISAVTPHSFRRTAATALKVGADAELAADQLGHSGTRVTEEHYIAKNRIVDERVADILERNFGNGG